MFDDGDIVLTSTSASDISIFRDNLIVAGSGQFSENVLDIKSPYLLTLDSSLNIIDSNVFKTETTASNVLLKSFDKDQCVLTFYAAQSLKNQEEQSEIKILDEEFRVINKFTYGHRTRIKDIAIVDHTAFFTLNYERSTQEISAKLFENSNEEFNVLVKESLETNIPVTITLLPEKQFAISGIANGFHYLDGHNYSNPLAYGFIRKFDRKGNELSRFNYKYSSHIFFNDMICVEDNLVVFGTKQSEETGMDLFILQFDDQLNNVWEKYFQTPGIQEASKIIFIEGLFYILSTTENLEIHNMSLVLMCIDQKGNIEWEKSFSEENRSSSAVDLVYFKSHLIILSQSKENRISSPDNLLYKISLGGDIIKKISLN